MRKVETYLDTIKRLLAQGKDREAGIEIMQIFLRGYHIGLEYGWAIERSDEEDPCTGVF